MNYPERLYNNGVEVAPSAITRNNASLPEIQAQIKTLQHWLACMAGYSRIADGMWNSTMTSLVRSLFPGQSTDEYFSRTSWDELERKMATLSPAGKKDLPRKKFSSGSGQAIQESLQFVGISIRSAAEIPAGLQLYQALVRGIDYYLDNRGDEYNETDRVYAELVNGNPVFTDVVWKNFERYWGLFYGAPWLGIVSEVPEPLKPREVLWCSAPLFDLLHQWGRGYLLRMQAKNALQEALNFPIIIRYTGNRLGGKVALRRDFSQIGMSAAIRVDNQNEERLTVILEALNEVDPAMRLRLNAAAGIHKPNLVYNTAMRNSSVLEYDPDQQRLLRQPALIAAFLRTTPAYFDHHSLERFARGVAAHAYFLHAEDLRCIFGSIKHLGIEKLIFFLRKLREYQALGPILNRIEWEGKDFMQVILSWELPDIGGEEITRVKDAIRRFQRYLVDAYQLSDQLRDIGYQAATTKARDLVSDVLKKNIPV